MNWPPLHVLDAYGPLRDVPDVNVGDRVNCWAGTGVINFIGKAFNGVQGIHSYALITLDDSRRCAEMVDMLTPAGFGTSVDGRLF